MTVSLFQTASSIHKKMQNFMSVSKTESDEKGDTSETKRVTFELFSNCDCSHKSAAKRRKKSKC